MSNFGRIFVETALRLESQHRLDPSRWDSLAADWSEPATETDVGFGVFDAVALAAAGLCPRIWVPRFLVRRKVLLGEMAKSNVLGCPQVFRCGLRSIVRKSCGQV